MSTKQGREKLKTYFETGDRPTEDEFSEFIDSGINQVDDTVHIAEVNGQKYMGVGRVDPTARLDVDGNINVSGHIFGRKAGMTGEDFLIVSNSAELQLFGGNHPNRKGDLFLIGDKRANGSGKISFDQRLSDTQWRSNMLIDTNGNVGIGTATPGNKLEIAVPSGNNTGLKLNYGAGQDKLLVSDANGNARWEQPTNLTNGFWTKNGNHIGNTNTGNVGVATTNPIGKLQVDDGIARVAIGSAYQLNSNGSSNTGYGIGYIGFNAARAGETWNLATDGGNNGGALMYSDVAGSINLATFPTSGGTPKSMLDTDMLNHIRLKIDGAGNVGIGTRSPAAKLDVQGNVSINDNSLYLRGGTDKHHGIQYNVQTDGPHLFGNSGGALATKSPGINGQIEENTAMQWFKNQSVDFKGQIKVKNLAPFVKMRFFVGNDVSRRTSDLTYASNNSATINNFNSNDWQAMIVGYQYDYIDGGNNDNGALKVMLENVNGKWRIDIFSPGTNNDHYVDVLFIRKEFF